jgi:large subunit ribosomal protein L23
MNKARLMRILVAPRQSEKATRLADQHRQFIFKVVPDATKPEIKQAIEFLFSVKVKNVQVVNVKGKVKNFGKKRGKRSNWKKAYVSLHEGFDIIFRVGE